MPILEADYSTTMSTGLAIGASTFDVAIAPTNTEGCLVLNRGQDNEEWIYMSSVSGLTVTVSHRGLSKTAGDLTEVTANKKTHYAGELVEWVNHPVHIINKQGDTVYGDILLDGTTELQFGTTASNIKDVAGDLTLEDANGSKTLSSIASTSTKLDDFATPDDNTDLDATTSEHGLMQKYPGGSTTYLREDGTWATPSGAGNVSTSDIVAVDNSIVREDGTSGTAVQKSLVTIDDSGSINIPTGEEYKINGTGLSDTTETLTNKTLTSPVVNTPTGIVKGDVGLENVDNVADASQTALGTVTSGNVDAIVPSNVFMALRLDTNLVLAASVSDEIEWDYEISDVYGFHSPSTPNRAIVPAGQGGLYYISVLLHLAGAIPDTSSMRLEIRKSSTDIIRLDKTSDYFFKADVITELSAGDVINIKATCFTTGNTIYGSSGGGDYDKSFFTMMKLT